MDNRHSSRIAAITLVLVWCGCGESESAKVPSDLTRSNPEEASRWIGVALAQLPTAGGTENDPAPGLPEEASAAQGVLESLKSALRSTPKNPQARFQLAGVYQQLGYDPLAERELAVLLRAYPNEPQFHTALGFVCLRNEQLDRAAIHFHIAHGLEPASPPLHYWLGVVLYKRHDLAAAKTMLMRSESAGYRDADLFYHLGRIQDGEGDLEKARQYYTRSLELRPDHPSSLYALSQVFFRLGRAEEAKHLLKTHERQELLYYRQLGVKEPLDEAELSFRLGQYLLRLGHADRAVEELEQSIKLRPERAEFHAALSEAYLAAGKKEAAEATMQHAAQLDPRYQERTREMK